MTTTVRVVPDGDFDHSWDYQVENFDRQEEPRPSILVSILADSPQQAEERALIYVRGNFGDGQNFYEAEFEGTTDGGRYFVNLYFNAEY